MKNSMAVVLATAMKLIEFSMMYAFKNVLSNSALFKTYMLYKRVYCYCEHCYPVG